MPARIDVADEVVKEIISLYTSGVSQREISKKQNLSRSIIKCILKENNVQLRTKSETNTRYFKNHDSFKVLTPESLYWCGFIAADGCIYTIDDVPRSLAVKLSITDKIHLENLRLFLQTNMPIYTNENSSSPNKYVSLIISSSSIANDLVKLGITSRKTFTMDLAEELTNSKYFWAGFFDGDGCWDWETPNNTFRGRIKIGCKQVLDDFKEFCINNVIKSKASVITTKLGLFYYGLSGTHAVKLAHLLYDDTPFALERKRNMALASCELMKNRRIKFTSQSAKIISQWMFV